MDGKYADVVASAEVIEYLTALNSTRNNEEGTA
jgi:hypothetical protein